MSKIRLSDVRRTERGHSLREQRDELLQSANRAEQITAGVETWIWKEYLEPWIQAEIDEFRRECVYPGQVPPGDFEKRQWLAFALDQLRERTLEHVGKKDEFMKQAEQLQLQIEEMEKEGLIEPERGADDQD